MEKIAKILIIEDSEDDLILMTHYIKQKCVNMEFLNVDSKPKLTAQLESEVKWDIIICDNNLPQLTGFEAIILVKEKYPNIPIICVSGSSIEESYNKCLEAGAIAFINKIHLEELADTVFNLLQKK